MNKPLMISGSRRAMAYPRRHRPGGSFPRTAAESRPAAYSSGNPRGGVASLRDATERLEQAARDVIALLPRDDAPASPDVPLGPDVPLAPAAFQGQLAALEQVLSSMNLVQAAAVDLVGHVQRNRIAVRRVGMTLAHFLAGFSRITLHERRTYLTVSKDLAVMPHLRRALQAGRVGFGEVRSIVTAARALEDHERADLDAMFEDDDWLGAASSDEVVDRGRRTIDAWQARRARERELRTIERRFLAITPQLDGALTLYGEFDAEAGATLLGALDAAMAPPTSTADHSRNALEPEHARANDPDIGVDHDPARDLASDPHSNPARDASPDFGARGRQRADALVRLAEQFLASPTPATTVRPHATSDSLTRDGELRDGIIGNGARDGRCAEHRSRPRVQVIADIATLAGDDTPARLLWEAAGPHIQLTAAAARKLASDATLQFVLTDGGKVLGISAPTAAIPARVRAAVHARDQGCRFPGCQAPIAWCDLHHVVPRERGGPTLVDNLVALCRRHHTAVTQSTWRLDMDADATVTVRRGRRSARSSPPLTHVVPRAHAPPGPGRASPPRTSSARIATTPVAHNPDPPYEDLPF